MKVGTTIAALALACLFATPVFAQRDSSKKADLKPRLEKLRTRDGVEVACGYFPSDKGKEAVPVVLLHPWEGSARTLTPLAFALQKAGCAVITPDLRGHGLSRTYTDVRGEVKEFNVSRMNRRDVQAMLSMDIETVKKFLKQENDEEKLNLNALTIVGVEQGAVLAANYAVIDWNFPDVGRKKQSKDVRALVLVSPDRNHEGFNLTGASRHPMVARLPWQFVVSDQSRSADEADKLYKQLERVRQGVGTPLVMTMMRGNKSGVELLTGNREVIPEIVKFVQTAVVEKQAQFPWIDRSGD